MLLTTGGGKTFIDIAVMLVGRFSGGPAKVAVIASAMFAMLSGSASANVVTTGTFTIPMMKKLGYRPEFAAGVEATASTGGIVTPPVMGAAAFIVAEFLGVPYLKVAVAAAIPAFLFYVAVITGVHFEAKKQNLASIPREQIPQAREVFTWSRMMCLLVPIGILLYTLVRGYSLIMISSSACFAVLVTYIFSSLSLRGIKERLWNIPNVLEAAGKAIMTVAPVLVCANIIIGLLTFTGLGVKISSAIMGLGEAYLILSLGMAAGLVLILGCGITVTAAYIIGTVMAVPMLIAWGIEPMAAHLFVMYYSILGGITPPVCPSVFLAANIAKAS
jgi:TRAP transporter 4TM/12TM fusion protein